MNWVSPLTVLWLLQITYPLWHAPVIINQDVLEPLGDWCWLRFSQLWSMPFVYTCIDYCNLLLIVLPKAQLASVQSVLSAAARLIARLSSYSHISVYMINELHWPPILAHIRHKVLLLVAKSQLGLGQIYLSELMCKPLSARSSCPLHSADRFDLLVPWSRTSLSQHPSLWNDNPPAVRDMILEGLSPASLRCLKTSFTGLSCWECQWIAPCKRHFINVHIR